MQIKDLRIGNIINYKGNYSNYKGITPLTPHLFRYLLEVDDEWELLDPIPLTGEWLIKSGFICTYWDESSKPINFELHVGIDKINKIEYNLYNNEIIVRTRINSGLILNKIKYVHQLQDLYFVLICEDLKIKNPSQQQGASKESLL